MLSSLGETAPEWSPNVARLDAMNSEQREFYDRTFLPALREGPPEGAEGLGAYVRVAFRESVADYYRDPDVFAATMEGIRTLAPHSADGRRAHRYEMEHLMLQRELDHAWDRMRAEGALDLNLYVTLAPSFPSTNRLTVPDVVRWGTADLGLSAQARAFREAVEVRLLERLDALHAEAGQSLASSYWDRLTSGAALDWVTPECEPFGSCSDAETHMIMHRRQPRVRRPELVAFSGEAGTSYVVPLPRPFAETRWVAETFRARVRRLFRDSEVEARAELGLPAIGEQWQSEATLFHEITRAFPAELVVHQGRPGWLGRQSFDIWLPQRNIAIEYQGEQHSGPVARFGGATHYALQLERDARKRAAAEANNCVLIEVFPGYILDDVVLELARALRGEVTMLLPRRATP